MENIANSNTQDDSIKPKVHFCKENVYIYPSSKEGIPGYLYIVEKFTPNHVVFLAWTPYYMLQQSNNSSQSTQNIPPQSDLYAIQVPLKEIRSIKRYIPTLGKYRLGIPHIIIVSDNGVAFPPYFFNHGGVREFFYALKEHVNLNRSPEDPNIFYLSELLEDPVASLRSSLDAERAQLFQTPEVQRNAPQPSQPVSQPPTKESQPSVPQPTPQQAKPPVSNANKQNQVENISWTILENFSKITQFARTAANGELFHQIDHQISQALESLDGVTIGAPKSVKKETSVPPVSHNTTLGNFEIVEANPINLPVIERSKELTPDEWISFFDKEGRILDEAGLKKRIHYGGVDPVIRIEVWKYLCGLYPLNSTYQERQQILDEKRAKYKTWKSTWQFIDKESENHWNKFKSRCHNVDKDVTRTDRSLDFYAGDENPNLKMLNDILVTYTFFNFDLSYVQGMNEILSPILFVMQNEADAYWCFKGIMDRVDSNFDKDQIGMHTQLVQLSKILKCLSPEFYDYLEAQDCLNMFFCFRWVLILFKREFSFQTIQRLWEVLWVNQLCPNFHLFLAVALLLQNKSTIMQEKMKFDDLVKFTNDLSGKINLDESLVEAESLYHTFMHITTHNLELRDELLKKQSFSRS